MIGEIPLRPLIAKQEDDPSLWVAHFGGSFNPVHIGHIAIGRCLVDKYSFDRVVYVPTSSHNPKPELAAEAIRLSQLQDAIADEPRFEACEYELNKEAWTEPFDTIMYLKEKYEQEAESVRMFTIRGDDYLPEMLTWTDELSEHEHLYEFVIVPRVNPSLEEISASPNQIDLVSRMSYLMTFLDPIEISSSSIRGHLKQGLAIETAMKNGSIMQIRKKSDSVVTNNGLNLKLSK